MRLYRFNRHWREDMVGKMVLHTERYHGYVVVENGDRCELGERIQISEENHSGRFEIPVEDWPDDLCRIVMLETLK